MLHKVTELNRAVVTALDGDVGSINDLYFDDEQWVVRYLVVNTGNWLSGRLVLISPHAVQRNLSTERQLRVNLDREQVRTSPPVETDKPISRRYEIAYATHYRYPYYWAGPRPWGLVASPGMTEPLAATGDRPPDASDIDEAAVAEWRAAEQSHLRSSNEVIGYVCQARDGFIGNVDDFLVDDKSWSIRQVVVDTKTWFPGGEVAVGAELISGVSWSDRKVCLDLDCATVRNSPRIR